MDGDYSFIKKKDGFISVICEIAGVVCDVTSILVRVGLQVQNLKMYT